jgi:hypothetical protein
MIALSVILIPQLDHRRLHRAITIHASTAAPMATVSGTRRCRASRCRIACEMPSGRVVKP